MLVGGACLAGVGFVALRWSRRDSEFQESRASVPADEQDQQLEARLDDELRNLD